MLTDQQRAEKSAEAIWANDRASQEIGIVLQKIQPGFASLEITVKEKHTNGHGICHGGVIFTLADTAFAFACNSYNQSAVAQHNSITYSNPAQLGDVLTASAKEIERASRSGIYDVRVSNQNDLTIAQFRGNSRTIKGQLFDEDT